VLYHNGKCIISNVERADTLFKRTFGLMFRWCIKNNYGLLFSLERQIECDVHMLFVLFDIDILFLDSSNTIVKTETLKSWTGHSKCFCKTIIECKSGTIDRFNLCIGDKLIIK